MASNSLLSLNFTPKYSKIPSKHLFSFPHSFPLQYIISNKRQFPQAAVASIPYQPINIDYLEDEFSGHGVSFESVGNLCVAKMSLENRSTASLMLPHGLITSYKAPMWHGGTLELLHTSVSEGDDGDAVIQGGVSLAFTCVTEAFSWSPTTWSLCDIRGNASDSIQIELIASDSEDNVEVKYIISLEEDILSSELVVVNSRLASLEIMGAVVSHLTVSTPDATYAIGLEGSDFFNRHPFESNFSIVPPQLGQNKGEVGSAWGQNVFKGLLFGTNARKENDADEVEMMGEEKDNYKQLNEEMSRIYTSAPRNVTVIDRGRRNSVILGRAGFEELYMYSPGSSQESYSKYSYVCVGLSALLNPIVLAPQDVWKGRQLLHNPNL
uniref:NDH-dependent cyclic electron flow 5 n=1 Tax=Melianthus villosus TaxID=377280 RepID=A0A0F7CYY5_9ROSI